MTIIDDTRVELVGALNVLMRRRGATTDPAEQAALDKAIRAVNRRMMALSQASLLDAARTVSTASDDLEAAVAAARKGPFDDYLADIGGVFNRLNHDIGLMHRRESLPPADATADPPAAEVATAPPAAGLPPINVSTRFADLRDEYPAYYARCAIRDEFADNVAYYVARLLKYKPRYVQVATGLGSMPWQLVGIIHALESGFDFTCHLHNGDPLTDRTRQVPAGRPPGGTPPFIWMQSAEDALTLKGLHQIDDWSPAQLLYQLERYNGFGYRRRGLPSPYLWSFSTLYSKGKFVADHQFDPDAVSKQCGAAAMLEGLEAKGEKLSS